MARRRVSWLAAAALAAVPLVVTGCDECWDGHCCDDWGRNGGPPDVPVGLVSTTGDGRVRLEWIDVQDDDLAGYRVYVSDDPDGPYDSIGETEQNRFVDHGAVNGRTYFYAVTAFDHCDNESDLSYETVHDTPRPEGFDLVLYRAGTRPADSGYDFSRFERQGDDDSGTDIYFEITSGTPWMYAASSGVRIQDVGYIDLEDLDWAPDGGWSENGRVELIRGHTYVVRTADSHYAKFNVVSLFSDRVTLDWAYQVDRDNRELSVGGDVTASNAPGGRPGTKIPAPERAR